MNGEPFRITLAAARVNAGLTQTAAAKAVGKGKTTIINWEKGRTQIDAANFKALCDLYRVSADYVFLPKN